MDLQYPVWKAQQTTAAIEDEIRNFVHRIRAAVRTFKLRKVHQEIKTGMMVAPFTLQGETLLEVATHGQKVIAQTRNQLRRIHQQIKLKAAFEVKTKKQQRVERRLVRSSPAYLKRKRQAIWAVLSPSMPSQCIASYLYGEAVSSDLLGLALFSMSKVSK